MIDYLASLAALTRGYVAVRSDRVMDALRPAVCCCCGSRLTRAAVVTSAGDVWGVDCYASRYGVSRSSRLGAMALHAAQRRADLVPAPVTGRRVGVGVHLAAMLEAGVLPSEAARRDPLRCGAVIRCAAAVEAAEPASAALLLSVWGIASPATYAADRATWLGSMVLVDRCDTPSHRCAVIDTSTGPLVCTPAPGRDGWAYDGTPAHGDVSQRIDALIGAARAAEQIARVVAC